MAIEIMWDDNGGLLCPVVFCDHCGLRIEDHADCNVEYLYAMKEKRTPYLKFLHKRCDHAFREAHPDYILDGNMWMWEECGKFLDQLAFNLKWRKRDHHD